MTQTARRLLLLCLLAAADSTRAAAPEAPHSAPTRPRPPFEPYRGPGGAFDRPTGWTVTPAQGGFFITEQPPPAIGPAIVVTAGHALPAMTSSQAVSDIFFQMLRGSLPTLAIVRQETHPQHPELHRAQVTYRQGAAEFDGLWLAAVDQGQFLFAMFSVPRARAAEFDADAMLLATLRPAFAPPTPAVVQPPSPATAAPEAAPPPAEPDEPELADEWFRPRAAPLRGFYGGAIWRDKLATHRTSSTGVPGQAGHQRADTVQTGGDFRVAFYTDGTVRARLLMMNYGHFVSYDVPFCYAGTYTLSPEGKLTTSDMVLAGNPRTYLKSEERLAKLRLTGQHEAQANAFAVHVEFFNPQKGQWDSKGEKRLTTATTRRTYGFGTATTPGGRIGTGAGP